MNITINDLPICGKFCVYDIRTGHYIHQYLDPSAPGDIMPDVAVLPVLGLRMMDDVLYIDTRTAE